VVSFSSLHILPTLITKKLARFHCKVEKGGSKEWGRKERKSGEEKTAGLNFYIFFSIFNLFLFSFPLFSLERKQEGLLELSWGWETPCKN